jgi:hypothetical protein
MSKQGADASAVTQPEERESETRLDLDPDQRGRWRM